MIGPYHENQLDCMSKLKDNQAIFEVTDSQMIIDCVDMLDQNKAAGRRAQDVWQSYQGIAEKVYQEIFGERA